MNGIEATRHALEILPEMKIIALSMYSEENYYASMIDAGASGFLLKNSKFNEVKRQSQMCGKGETIFRLRSCNRS